ncbi:hypothetical protein J3E64_003576 [Sphingobium sp. OAS761]|nr:hypothetical protein [Sphingobium sp. OAS761]
MPMPNWRVWSDGSLRISKPGMAALDQVRSFSDRSKNDRSCRNRPFAYREAGGHVLS